VQRNAGCQPFIGIDNLEMARAFLTARGRPYETGLLLKQNEYHV